jgi:hypothetical protein
MTRDGPERRRGRPPRAEFVIWELPLSAEIAARVELLLLDPVTQRPKSGARGKLVERLLREWLDGRKDG